MKRIVVMPVKNEGWILERTLGALCLWADVVIVADQSSTDGSLGIYAKFSKVKVVNNPAEYHNSNVRKLLLDEARKVEGPKVIFSFDADEVPTVHIIKPEFWEKVDSLPTGTSLEFEWVNLWRSVDRRRIDDNMWSGSWKAFGFIDDDIMDYENIGVINDHTSRIPKPATERVEKFELPKVLHFQFVDWNRMLSKQALYRLREYIQKPHSFLKTVKINLKYVGTKDEGNLQTEAVPGEWVKDYREMGIDLSPSTGEDFTWFDREVLLEFLRTGTKVYSWLDIWDVDWNRKARIAAKLGIKDFAEKDFSDPRTSLQKFYHKLLPLFPTSLLTRLYLICK